MHIITCRIEPDNDTQEIVREENYYAITITTRTSEALELYEFCEEVRTEHMRMLYKRNVCTKDGLQNVVKFINSWAGTQYTPEDVYVEWLV